MEPMDRAQELYDRVAPHIRLENTRILAKGIQLLCRQRRQEGGEDWSMHALIQFVQDAYNNSRENGEYLAQNPNTDLFRFRNSPLSHEAEKTQSEDERIRLAAMVLMYRVLTQLGEVRRNEGAISASYETLCCCLRDILNFNMCYIAYQYLDDTRILAASSVYHDDLVRILSGIAMAKELDTLQRILNGADDGASGELEQFAGNIFLLKRNGEKEKIEQKLYVLLEFAGQDKSPDERLFLVFHREQKGKAEAGAVLPGLLGQLRDALFLRGMLIDVLDRDFRHLMNIHQEYRGITRKSRRAGRVRILHLSDLHVSKENSGEIIRCIQALGQLEEGDQEDGFDFIAITGDVAQGRCAAGDLEENYRCAAQVIRELAFQIWSHPAERRGGKARVLDQDWKKRLLIIPGNHDYASMNELETQHDETHRASAGGRPAAKEGSPMAKFTYYINFLRQLLDVDIGPLIDNGLNEFRRYDDLQVGFLLLNTSIMANPLRNNKVHLDGDFVEHVDFKLQQSIQAGNKVVCLCHHGPRYHIDYLSDQYYEEYVCAELTRKFEDWVRPRLDLPDDLKPREEIAAVDLEMMNQAWDEVECVTDNPLKNDSIQIWLLKNSARRIPEDIKERVAEKRRRSRLYLDSQILQGQEMGSPALEIDERYQSVLHALRRALILSAKDSETYQKTFDRLKGEKKGRLTVTLSGHTHKRDHHRAEDDPMPQYVADRFFTKWYRYVDTEAAKTEEDESRSIYQREIELYPWLKYGVCTLSDLSDEDKVRYCFYGARFSPDDGKEGPRKRLELKKYRETE